MRKRYLLSFLLLLFTTISHAAPTDAPLPPAEAFQLHVIPNQPSGVTATWSIAPGYYLYQQAIKVALKTPQTATLNPLEFPPAQTLDSSIGLGALPVYAHQLSLPISFQNNAPNQMTLVFHYQGCSQAGFCYPPLSQTATINLTNGIVNLAPIQQEDHSNLTLPSNNTDHFTNLLSHDHSVRLFFIFLGLGLLLALTPCVLPILPILASLIAGQKKPTLKRSFLLSLSYVLGMAITFSIAGLAVGWLGQSLQSFFQNPWTISIFSLLFVLLAFSLFGWYELRWPARWQTQIHTLSARQKSGSYWGAAVMGCLSTLVASPCVSAPLVGVLGYISTTGHAWTGGLALFALGLGMGLPLLLLGVSGGKFLPKAGPWLQNIKTFCGILLLALAISFLSRILPGALNLFVWGGGLIMFGVYLWYIGKQKLKIILKGLSLIVLLYGALLIIGASMGHRDFFAPLRTISMSTNTASAPASASFETVNTVAALNQALTAATSHHQPVLIDVYAQWCLDCQVMDSTVFTDPAVLNALHGVKTIRVDISKNNAATRALEKKLQALAPPTLIFMDAQGHERARFVGKINAATLIQNLNALQTATTSIPSSTVGVTVDRAFNTTVNFPTFNNTYSADAIPKR